VDGWSPSPACHSSNRARKGNMPMPETFGFIDAATVLLVVGASAIVGWAVWRTAVAHVRIERRLAAIQNHLTHWTPPR
jgi:hypothetical protein